MKTSEIMEKRSGLFWQPTRSIRFCGRECEIKLKVSLSDECHNGICDFSITSFIYLKNPRGNEDRCVGGGCNHDEIVKYFPELTNYVPLHLCSHYGCPMYAVSNGSYILQTEGKCAAKKYLRCTDEEIEKLSLCCDDKLFFKYQLFALGIVDRWRREADEFISFLEEKCGYKWENPYTQDMERFTLLLSEEEKKTIEDRIKTGYYDYEEVHKREQKAKQVAKQKAIDEINAEYEKKIENSRNKRDVLLYILDCGLPLNNVIYYEHSNEVCFNWRREHRITKEEFTNFVDNVDYSKVPKGVKFTIKY